MVLMSVGNDKAFYLVQIVFQICGVRDNKVNTQHIILRKGQTAVHHNDTVFVLKGSNVHTDLLQAAQRDDFQLGSCCILFFLQSIYLHAKADRNTPFRCFRPVFHEHFPSPHEKSVTGTCGYCRLARFLFKVWGVTAPSDSLKLFTCP